MASVKDMANWTLTQIAQHREGVQPGSPIDHAAKVELERRQAELNERSARAQELATEAAQAAAISAKKAAKYTKRNALYMLISVIVLAASSVASFLLALWK